MSRVGVLGAPALATGLLTVAFAWGGAVGGAGPHPSSPMTGEGVSPSVARCVSVGASPGDVAVINITNTDADGIGWGALRPSGATPVYERPTSQQYSSVNFAAESPANPNLAVVEIGTDGEFCYDNALATADVILDLSAVIPAANIDTTTTERILDTRTEVVIIGSAKEHYTVGETVGIVIENGLPDPITAHDQRGFCTIVEIEQLVGQSWVAAAPCLSGPPPSDVTLIPGSTRIDLPQPLPTGTYRARLRYSVGSTFVVGSTHDVVTAPFTVG